MNTRIQKWGNSLALRIPKTFAEETGLERGSPVEMSVVAGQLLIDSSGLKVYGEGEWKVRQHGYSKPRTWRKFHIRVEERTLEIQEITLTEAGTDDANQVTACWTRRTRLTR
jgi:hypothetical protein